VTRAGAVIDLLRSDARPMGRQGAGAIHHVAFRAETDDAQLEWGERLRMAGLQATQVIDRQYFHSIYFREPGGVLFEIATDPPGFAVDEPEGELGRALKLPPRVRGEPRLHRAPPAAPPGPGHDARRERRPRTETSASRRAARHSLRARLAVVALHGRGGSPEDMLALVEHLALPDVACLAPEARGGSWWPQSFLAPLRANEPALSSASGRSSASCGASTRRASPQAASRARLQPGRLPRARVRGARRTRVPGRSPASREAFWARARQRVLGARTFTATRPSGSTTPVALREPTSSWDATSVIRTSRSPECARARRFYRVWAGEVRTDIYPGAGHGVLDAEIQALRGLLNR
jgi:hypothetical protein